MVTGGDVWNDLGAGIGWTSWLLMALGMFVFWGAVLMGLWAAFQIPRPTEGSYRGHAALSERRRSRHDVLV